MTPGHNLNQPDRLLSFSRALEIVGISRSQVYLLLARAEFPTPVKIGRTNYFSHRELLAWIDGKIAERDAQRTDKPGQRPASRRLTPQERASRVERSDDNLRRRLARDENGSKS